MHACIVAIFMHVILNLIAATETKKPEYSDVAIQCNLLDAPPLEKLTSSEPQQSLDDSFTTVTTITEQDDADSFTCSQQDCSTEYVHMSIQYIYAI